MFGHVILDVYGVPLPYHGTQPSELFSTNVTQLSAYHNLSDPKKVNPDQKISQKCSRMCSCS